MANFILRGGGDVRTSNIKVSNINFYIPNINFVSLAYILSYRIAHIMNHTCPNGPKKLNIVVPVCIIILRAGGHRKKLN